MSVFDGIPTDILAVLDTLGQSGFDAWLVGGCVRDMLSGRRPKDYDIATSALPRQTSSLFAKTRPTGEKYGTVTVFCGSHSAEVTTFRKEAGYADFRRPSEIAFSTDIAQDLSRRDFTVNAIAFHPQKGVFDPFGGRDDLEQGVLRAVGDPDKRFREDALRILRAFRFSAEHSYRIEPNTYRAAVKNAGLIEAVSAERIKAEFDRMLPGRNPTAVFQAAALAPFSGLFPRRRAGESNVRRFSRCPRALRCRWAAFLFLTEADEARVSDRMKFDSRLKKDVAALRRFLAAETPEGRVGLKRWLGELPPDLLCHAIQTRAALFDTSPEPALAEIDGILRSGEPYSLSTLALDGAGLKALGIAPGPEYGMILNALLSAVIDDPGQNTAAALSAKVLLLHRRFQGDTKQ